MYQLRHSVVYLLLVVKHIVVSKVYLAHTRVCSKFCYRVGVSLTHMCVLNVDIELHTDVCLVSVCYLSLSGTYYTVCITIRTVQFI